MAIVSVNAYSDTLKRKVMLTACLPSDVLDGTGQPIVSPPYKTLYLLHGIKGSQNDWLLETRLVKYAREYQIAIIMPAGENLFYVNQALPGPQYATFIGDELVALTRRLFPLSHKRSDTFIAGLSMGGDGAVINGLMFADRFSAIGSFSGALVTDALVQPEAYPEFAQSEWASYIEYVLGSGPSLLTSDKNPKHLVEQLIAQQKLVPDFFITCGLQDELLPVNRMFVEFLREQNQAVTYQEAPGKHDWSFWDDSVKQFLAWLFKREDH